MVAGDADRQHEIRREVLIQFTSQILDAIGRGGPLPAGADNAEIRIIGFAQNQVAGGPSECPNLRELIRRLMSLCDI